MKRILVLLCAVTILLSGCTQKPNEDTSKPPESSPSSAVSEIPLPEPKIVQCEIVNVQRESFANVRQGPGTDQEVIGKAYLGDKFDYVEKGSTSDWIKIKYNNAEGYVYKDFIVINS